MKRSRGLRAALLPGRERIEETLAGGGDALGDPRRFEDLHAVNLPVLNVLNFPAAELQAPHLDEKASAAMNYGAIGTIIGHEISHRFNDQGAMFDAPGQLKNWWTPADFAHFQASSAQLARESDGYRPFPDQGVNGKRSVKSGVTKRATQRSASNFSPTVTRRHYRAQTVRNLDAWYPALDVTQGRSLYLAPRDRVKIW